MSSLVGKVINGNRVILRGSVKSRATLVGKLSKKISLSGKAIIPAVIGEVVDYYDGDYKITPRCHEPVVMNTKKKIMNEDVTVKAIPYFSTSNTAGGNTIYIGSEV